MKRFYIFYILLTLLLQHGARAQWGALSGPPGANVQDMERTPNGHVYIVANNDLFVSTNNADSWQPLNVETPANLDVSGITSDAAGTLYGVNYSRLYKSTDNGLNWELLSNDGDFYGVVEVSLFGPDNYVVIHGWNGVFISKDEGTSWIKIWDREPYDLKTNAAGDIFIITSTETNDEGTIRRYSYPGAAGEWDPANWVVVYTNPITYGWSWKLFIDASSRIYASIYNDVLISVNNGTDWTSIKSNLTETYFTGGVWGQASDGTVFLTNVNANPSLIYSTTDQGASWNVVSCPTDPYGTSPSRLSFGSGSTIFLSSQGAGVFRSDNGGATWEFKSSGLKYGNGHDVEIADDGRIIYLNNYVQRGYWTSSDNGLNWSFETIDDFTQKVLKLSGGKIFLYSGGPVYESTNNGVSFVKISDSNFNTLIEDASANLYATEYSKILVSADLGVIWTDLALTVTGLPLQYFGEYLMINPSGTHLFAMLYNYDDGSRKLYKIPVAGGAALVIDVEPWLDDDRYGVNNVFFSDNKLYVAEYETIYESPDEGATWNLIGFSGQRVFPIEGGLCVSRNGALYTTQDGGKSWNNSSLPNSSSIIQTLVPVADGFIAAATNSTALKYTGELILPVDQLPPFIPFDWQPTDGPYGGYISKVFSDDSQNSYALSDGRLFKTLTFSTWEKLPADNGHLYSAFYDADENALYTTSYSWLMKSTNGGSIWTTVSEEEVYCGSDMVKSANGTIVLNALCGTAGVYMSSDGGASFGAPKLTREPNSTIYRIAATSSGAIFVHTYDFSTSVRKLLRTQNDGDTFEEIETPLEHYQVGVDKNGDLYIWWSTAIHKSTDDGQTWMNISGDLPGGFIDFNGQPTITATGALMIRGYSSDLGIDGFWKTLNGGENWILIPSEMEITSVNVVGNRIVTGTPHGVFTTDDEGETFTERSEGINISDLSDLELIGPTEMIALNYGNPSFGTSDFQTWGKKDDLAALRFFKNPDGSLIAHSNRDFFKKDVNGEWVLLGTSPEYFYGMASGNGQTYFIATSTRKILYSNNFENWTQLNVTGLPEEYGFSSMAVTSEGFVFIVISNYQNNYEQEAYQIVFGAAIKIDQTTNPISVFYNNAEGKIILYDRTGSILETSDGSVWSSRSTPAGAQLFITEMDYYFISQWDGTLWLSRNEGQTWQSVGSAGGPRFTNIAINEYDGYAYATLYDQVIHKSANIVIPPESTPPVMVAVSPANNATGVVATAALTITFDEVVKSVSGKKVRILDLADPINPVEIIDAAEGVLDGKSFTFTPAQPFTYEQTYFIIVDNGAFTDIFGNPYNGIATNSVWRFTVQAQPDDTEPVIAYSPVIPAFTKGASNKIQITATDEDGGTGVDPASVKIYYRGITSSENPASATMTLLSGDIYEIVVPDAWLDELGLEFRFEASDHGGNAQSLPLGGAYYKGYFNFVTAANPTLPGSVLSIGGQEENYRIFGIPHKLASPSINTIFGELESRQPKTDFRILHFNNASNQYTEFPTMSTISRGLGYWINLKDAATLVVEGATTPENSKEDLFSYSLRPGWNQIGNPYPFPISWNAVRDASGNAEINVLKSYNGSSFVDDDILNPFEGGFVLLTGTANVNVVVPFSAKATSGGRAGDLGPDFEGGWMLPLKVENSKLHSLGGVGMHADADLSFDAFDDAMPPQIFEIPEISFPHAEHFIKNFTRDIVPPLDEYKWDLTVDAGEEQVVLSWDVNAVMTLSKEMHLLDEGQQRLINMAEEGRCEIPARKSATFKVYYGTAREDIKPSKIILGKPYPNPFTSRSAISFTLPENQAGAYNVSLDVYDMLGRKVATVAMGEFASGFYTREWIPEPRDVNTSLFLYRLTVSDNKSTIVLTEKAITKK